jgi:pyrroline-5-carboxylate reductase
MGEGRIESRPRVAILGGGVMREAILASVLSAGWDTEEVAVTEPDAVRANEIAPQLRTGAVVVSIAAGLLRRFYEGRLPAGTPVVRVMPNAPAVIGMGASAISAGSHATTSTWL